MAKQRKGKATQSLSSKPASAELGDFIPVPQKFGNLHAVLKELQGASFARMNIRQKTDRVNSLLFDLINQEKTPCFLLPAVMEFIEKINKHGVLESYSFPQFELWLNQFAEISSEDNVLVRAKIVGKHIPRDAYQVMFPIGMGKKYPGSHYVTAHSSPDLDTTVASFWGWVDAFGARVCEGVHIWNLPGGPPTAQVEIGFLFSEMFGPSIFDHLPKTRTSLSLSGIDLISQERLVRKQVNISTINIEHDAAQHAVILVDEQGYYLGDWRSYDVEIVRQVINLLNGCLRWFENFLHVKLIALFAKNDLSTKDIPGFIKIVLQMHIEDCQPAKEFSGKQKADLEDYMVKVLKIKEGLQCSFEEFAIAMKQLSLFEFQEFVSLIEALPKSKLFDRSGFLVENRPKIFELLEKIIRALDKAIYSMRLYVEKLDVALKIKTEVFGYNPSHVSYRADVEEIRSKMGNFPYLTVTTPDQEGKWIPLGVVYAAELHKPVLGTVTLRDFCNREETKIPSYFEVISVIDHHKSSLQTSSAPLCIVSDAQSSNVLCAEVAFQINDNYSLGGLSAKQIDNQIGSLEKNLNAVSKRRLMQRLLQRSLVSEQKGSFFIDSCREYYEYLHFLYAILDDTDLLTKVTRRDVECVASLLNRMKSLSLQKEVEAISLDDLTHDKTFAVQAAKRILQHPDMYSLYRKIYRKKEELVEENCKIAAKGLPSSFFDDTKEQNGCARVGQTKLFNCNYSIFAKHSNDLRTVWYHHAAQFWKDRPEVDFHLHMISTVSGADDLFQGKDQNVSHQDELWIWIPFTEQSIEHLKSFLNAFRRVPQISEQAFSAEIYGPKAKEYERIFAESFLSLRKKVVGDKRALPIVVLKYKAGLLNSRKAMVSPHLPRLVGG
jgi:hypothetical protein